MLLTLKIVLNILLPVAAIACLVVGLVYINKDSDTDEDISCDTPGVPTSLSISTTDENTIISWTAPGNNVKCAVTYKLRYTIDGGENTEFNTTNLSHTVPSLETCSTLNVQIWAINELGEQSENAITQTYDHIPDDIPSPVDVELATTAEGFEITWTKPAGLDKCDISYEVIAVTDTFNTTTKSTDSENFTVSADTYCFYAAVTVSTVISDSRSSLVAKIYRENDVVENLQVLPPLDDSNELTVVWNSHPAEQRCYVQYLVVYDAENGGVQTTTTSEPSATFNFIYCNVATVAVTAVAGIFFNEPNTIDATLYPSRLESVTEPIITLEEGKRIASWSVENINNCNITYNLMFTTDLDSYTYLTENTTFEIPEEIYCFSIELEVQPLLGDVSGDAVKSTTYEYDLEQPQDLILSTSFEENTLTSTWIAYQKQEQCNIQYNVVYEYGERLQVNVSESTITFNITYCSTATVTVFAFSDNKESDESTVTEIIEEPVFLQPVQRISVQIVDSVAVVSWDPPDFASQCVDILYEVTARNEFTDEENTNSGTNTCDILLDDFCPYTNFTILGSSIPGEEATYTYYCEDSSETV